MTRMSSCPSAIELGGFLLGDLSEPEAEGMEQHLLECDACIQTLATLQAEDTLRAALAEETGRNGDIESAGIKPAWSSE